MYQCPCNCISKASLALNRTMRMLWEQHVAWTRMTIISIASNLPDLGPVSNRLLRNATDFAVALTPFYGSEKASKFGGLLHDHLVIAANLVMAAKAGNGRCFNRRYSQAVSFIGAHPW